jgi:ADP-ribose pyrophosphatase
MTASLQTPRLQHGQDLLQGADQRLAEQTRHSEHAYHGVFFDVTRDQVSCPDGHQGVREYIDHPGAVMIIALTADGHILLERQYRHPLKRCFIEMPAGKLERGEDPLACAQRELLEETGYRAQRWQRLGAFHNAIGYTNEQIAVYLARDLSYDQPKTEAGEVLEIFLAPWQDLPVWVEQGAITDVKTMIGAYWLQRVMAGEFAGSAGQSAL